jgi:hypothetical protein
MSPQDGGMSSKLLMRTKVDASGSLDVVRYSQMGGKHTGVLHCDRPCKCSPELDRVVFHIHRTGTHSVPEIRNYRFQRRP